MASNMVVLPPENTLHPSWSSAPDGWMVRHKEAQAFLENFNFEQAETGFGIEPDLFLWKSPLVPSKCTGETGC